MYIVYTGKFNHPRPELLPDDKIRIIIYTYEHNNIDYQNLTYIFDKWKEFLEKHKNKIASIELKAGIVLKAKKEKHENVSFSDYEDIRKEFENFLDSEDILEKLR
jgi:hypothetical protein